MSSAARDHLQIPRKAKMVDEIIARLPERDDVKFAARMTNIQFSAVARRLEREVVVKDIESLLACRDVTKGRHFEPAVVKRWLLNGWNTEQLLRTNRALLVGDALRHSLHWAFPQAYYSVFAVALAYFKSVGYSEESHSAVIRKFGTEAAAKRYPAALCALAHGHPPAPLGVAAYKLPHSLYYDPEVRETIEAQLSQFLCATRKIDLDEKKGDIPIRTKAGSRKKAFRADDWAKVSNALGYTSLLSLLYRKRIKANYRDIDTFLHGELQAETLYLDLLRIVSTVNLVHEVLISKAAGIGAFKDALSALPVSYRHGPRVRLPLIERLST
jgi:hypothetical protein